MNCFFSLIKEPDWSFKCSVKGKKSILMYPTVRYDKSTNEDFYINVNKNLAIINYEEQNSWIEFYSKRESKCDNSSYFNVYLYAKANNIPKKSFQMFLGSPNYAYMDCEIPSINVIGDVEINCILDIKLFPIFSYSNLRLPDDFPNIGFNQSNWTNVPKDFNGVFCHPKVKEIKPYLVKEPKCVMDNLNAFLGFASNGFSSFRSNFTFYLNVKVNDEYERILCEYYQKNY